jgi:hypothetical protein
LCVCRSHRERKSRRFAFARRRLLRKRTHRQQDNATLRMVLSAQLATHSTFVFVLKSECAVVEMFTIFCLCFLCFWFHIVVSRAIPTGVKSLTQADVNRKAVRLYRDCLRSSHTHYATVYVFLVKKKKINKRNVFVFTFLTFEKKKKKKKKKRWLGCVVSTSCAQRCVGNLTRTSQVEKLCNGRYVALERSIGIGRGNKKTKETHSIIANICNSSTPYYLDCCFV